MKTLRGSKRSRSRAPAVLVRRPANEAAVDHHYTGSTIPDVVAIVDLDEVRPARNAFHKQFITNLDARDGADSFAGVHPADKLKLRHIVLETITAGTERRGHYSVTLADDTTRTFEAQRTLAWDEYGNPSRIVVTLRDITTVLHIQEQQRRTEQELDDFFENSPIALRWIGRDGAILRANKAELTLLGYTRRDYFGHHISEFLRTPSDAVELMNRLMHNETIHNFETQLRCKDGSSRDVLISSNGLWHRGKFVHSRCFTRDITKWKQVERERASLLREHQSTLNDMHILKGLLPICAWCKKVRDDEGYWKMIEEYIEAHSDMSVTHGICPECIRKYHSNHNRKVS